VLIFANLPIAYGKPVRSFQPSAESSRDVDVRTAQEVEIEAPLSQQGIVHGRVRVKTDQHRGRISANGRDSGDRHSVLDAITGAAYDTDRRRKAPHGTQKPLTDVYRLHVLANLEKSNGLNSPFSIWLIGRHLS
jgi:hypothetical protein